VIGSRTGFSWRVLALVAFVVGTAVVFLLLFNVAGGVNVGKRYRFTAVVPTALQLADNADVNEAGVHIGRVEQISNRGATAVLRLAIDPDRGPVHGDARVHVRAKTLVGENYVDLDPGTPSSPAIPDGGELPIARARVSTQLDDVLSTLSAPRRARLRRLLAGLGPGLGDGKADAAVVSGVAELFNGAKRMVEPLYAERAALRRLVPDLGTVFRAVGERREMIRRLVVAARRTATTVAAEDTSLAAGLRELPPALVRVRGTTAHLAAVGGRAGPVLDDLTAALHLLTPVAQELPAASHSTLGALRRLAGASPAARRLLRSLRSLGSPAAALVPRLDAVLRDLRPAVQYLAPYGKDIGSFFAGVGQATTAHDATGHLARIQPVLNPSALTLVGETERQAIDKLLGLGVGRLVNLRGTNSYPKPNALATPGASTGPYPRLQRDGKR
jgi:phospholipid/cholesterol/gamma-HCH transport system substrate-binding protein